MSEQHVDVDTGGGRQERRIVDYPGNSKRLKEVKDEPAKAKVEKIVTGNVVQRKKSLATRMFGEVVAEDSKTVIDHLILDVLVPAFKNLIVDFVSEGVNRAVYGDSRPRSASRPTYTTYSNRFQGRTGEPQRPSISSRAREMHNFNDVILVDRGDAEDVLDGLRELIERYQTASVADFYGLIGITTEFTDNKHGWTDLRSAQIVGTRGGWMFRLPRTEPLTET